MKAGGKILKKQLEFFFKLILFMDDGSFSSTSCNFVYPKVEDFDFYVQFNRNIMLLLFYCFTLFRLKEDLLGHGNMIAFPKIMLGFWCLVLHSQVIVL